MRVSYCGALAVGESYEQVVSVDLPEHVSGELFITLWSDAGVIAHNGT